MYAQKVKYVKVFFVIYETKLWNNKFDYDINSTSRIVWEKPHKIGITVYVLVWKLFQPYVIEQIHHVWPHHPMYGYRTFGVIGILHVYS
jgi:hypothetical protein